VRLKVAFFGLMTLSLLLWVRAAEAAPIPLSDSSPGPANNNVGVDLSSLRSTLEDARIFAFDNDVPFGNPDSISFKRHGKPDSNPKGIRTVPEPSSLLLLGSSLLGLGFFHRKRVRM